MLLPNRCNFLQVCILVGCNNLITKYFILYTIGNDKILHIAYSVFLYLSNGIISSKCVTHCLHHVFTLVEEHHVGRVGVTCRSNEMRTF